MIRIGPLRVFGSLISFLAFACGNTTLDLGGPDEIKASEDPSVLGTIQEEVAQLAVDGQRLYWLGSGPTRTAYGNNDRGGPHPWALRGCDIANCAESRLTYAPDSVDPAAGFGVHEGRLSWFRLLDIPGQFGGQGLSQLLVFDGGGYRGPSQLMGPEIFSGRRLAAFDAGHVYFIRGANDFGHEIMSLGLNGEVAAPRSVTRPGPGAQVLEVAAYGDYLYWILSSGHGAGIQRVRKDGTGPTALLVAGLRISGTTNLDEIFPAGGLAFDSTYFYFAENAEDGAIKRCPLTGCVGAPEVIAEPVRSPLALLIDGSRIYWAARTSDRRTYSLSSCDLPRCSKVAKEVDDLATPAAFTKDDRYLYAATNELHYEFLDQRASGFINSLRKFE